MILSIVKEGGFSKILAMTFRWYTQKIAFRYQLSGTAFWLITNGLVLTAWS
jgi:hypothetical protein